MTRGFPIKIQIALFLLAFLGLLALFWFWADVNRTSQLSERNFEQIEDSQMEVLAGLGGQLLSVNQPEGIQPVLATLVETAQIEAGWLIDRVNQIVAGVPANWIGKAPPDFTQKQGAAIRWRVRVLKIKGRPVGKLAILFPNPPTAWVGRLSGQGTLIPVAGMILMALVLGFMAALFFNRRLGWAENGLLRVLNQTDRGRMLRPGEDATAPGESASSGDFGRPSRKVERVVNVKAALLESRERYVRALTGGSDGFWDWNIETGENYFSRQWLENLGYADGDLERTQDTFNSLIHPADLDAVSRAKSAHLERGEPYNVEFRIRKKDGDYLWVRSKGHVEWNEAGRPVGMTGTLSDISQRKAVEEAFHESEARYRRLYNHTPVMMHTFDDEGGLLSINEFWLSEMGYQREELTGKHFADFMPEHHKRLAMNDGMLAFQRDGFLKNLPSQYIKKNGEVMDIQISATRVVSGRDGTHQNLAFISDITNRVRAERKLRENQRLLQSVFDTIPQWIFVKDPEHRYLLVNRALAKTCDSHPDDFINATAADFSIGTEAQREIFRKAELSVIKSVSAVEFHDVEVTFPDGQPHFQHIVKMPLLDDRGEITGVLGVVEDITERKRIEAQLRLQAQIIEQTHECIITADGPGLITSWNGGAERLFGYTAKEAIGKMKAADLYPADQQMFHQKQVLAPAIEKGNITLEVIMQKKSGGEFNGLLSLTSLKNERGEVTGRIGHTLDITERKLAEEALKGSEQRFRNLIEGSLQGIYIMKEYKLLFANQAMADMFGFDSVEKLLAIDNFLDIFAPQFRKQARRRYEDRRGGKNIKENFEIEGIRKDGSSLWVEGLAKGVIWEGKEVVQCTLFDVTKRKQAEEELKIHRDHLEDLVRERTQDLEKAQAELVRKEKLGTLGQLTATVSHELRNPLGTIRTSLFSILKKTSPDTLGIGKTLARIDRNVTRCDDIIGDLLDFTRDRAPSPSTTDVDEWIADLMKEQVVPDWLELKFNLAVNNRPVELDRDYIRRAVINLFDNARQALEAWPDGSMGKRAKVIVGARIERKWLKISVKDTGPGMTQEVLDKIFEPLFSTKTFGVGLGLPTVHQIMQLNGGTISIKSQVGKGTQAVLKLPLNTLSENKDAGPVA